jgi:uncharacterized RDD family membrane protein YckC
MNGWGLPDRSASFSARLRGGAVDWAICGALAYVIVLVVALLSGDGGDSTIGVVAYASFASAVIVGYFAYFWASRGATPGMRAAGVRVVGEDGGRLGVARAVLRAAAALVSGVSALVVLVTLFSDRPERGYSTATIVLFVAALTLGTTSLLGHLWLLRDRRTWHDKLFGLVVVPAETTTAAAQTSSATPPPPG